MKLLVNLFCPIEKIFLETNLETLGNLLSQYRVWPKKKTSVVVITGYAVCIDAIRSFLKEKFSDLEYRFDLTCDYGEVKSKCHLLNRYISERDKDPIFYCEYDITVPDLFQRLEKLEQVSRQERYKHIGLWCFNSNVHQMTIYETTEQTEPSLTILRPSYDNGMMIGTGCWLLNLNGIQSNGVICCPSYGYGHDDLHLSTWLRGMELSVAVVKEWWCDHRSVEFPPFVEWKMSVLVRQRPLSREEYEKFWEESVVMLDKGYRKL